MYSISVRLFKLKKKKNGIKQTECHFWEKEKKASTYTHKDIQHLQLPDNHQTFMTQNFSCCMTISKYATRIRRNVHRS